jgi:hypothetical protein
VDVRVKPWLALVGGGALFYKDFFMLEWPKMSCGNAALTVILFAQWLSLRLHLPRKV